MKKCHHPQANKNGTCPVCSRVKMVIITEEKKEAYPVWYSYIKYNNRPVDTIITGMFARFIKSSMRTNSIAVQFYDNTTKDLIETKKG